MINYKEIPHDDDTWELFARDFLSEIGFFIESTPDRGPDAGKDILVTEDLKGYLNNYRFRWLVSCKHHAKSGLSVSEKDEPNILERLGAFRADGFLGFYSTIASSGLNSRLKALTSENKIKDFRIFDGRLIENYLLRLGFSKLLMRYYPDSYKNIKPLHKVIDEYVSLKCDVCGKDLLEDLYKRDYKGLIAQATRCENDGKTYIDHIYYACKGKCDKSLSNSLWNTYKITTAWKDISDLVIPADYLRWIMATMNHLKSGKYVYSDEAFEKEKHMIIALSQKVLREMTEKERERVRLLIQMPF